MRSLLQNQILRFIGQDGVDLKCLVDELSFAYNRFEIERTIGHLYSDCRIRVENGKVFRNKMNHYSTKDFSYMGFNLNV